MKCLFGGDLLISYITSNRQNIIEPENELISKGHLMFCNNDFISFLKDIFIAYNHSLFNDI